MLNKNDTKYYVDENNVRLIALLVVIISVLSIWQHWKYLMLLLSIDFALRAFTTLPSPLAKIAKTGRRFFHLTPRLVFAAPKKFAAGIGFTCSAIIFGLMYFDLWLVAAGVGSVLICFAILEAALSICVGCYVFNYVVVPIVHAITKSRATDDYPQKHR